LGTGAACTDLPITCSVYAMLLHYEQLTYFPLGVHGSAHRNINLIERTNKMQPRSRIYSSNVS